MVYGTLWAAACFVLLIACANLTNLTLVRTIGRWRDFETRLALGAGQVRMIRQVLMESMALAGAAGILGWWITNWAIRSWAAATASEYQILDYRVDTETLAYLAAISVVAAILFSLAPIAKLVELCANGSFSRSVRASQGPRGRHLSNLLVGGQMALAIVLLSGAGVLVRSFVTIVTAETGVRDPEQILTGMLALPSDKYADAAVRLTLIDRLESQLKNLPSIQSVALASRLPVLGMNVQAFEIEGRPSPPAGSETSVPFVAASPDYFRVPGASALAGREFTEFDRTGSLPVALVNRSFADRFFPGAQPLGQRIRVKTRNQSREWRTVVGVVSNIMQGDATRQNFKPLVYVPIRQESPTAAVVFLMRMAADRQQAARAVQGEIARLDSDLILRNLQTLKASFAFDGDNMDVEHMELGKDAAVAPVFALLAVLLAAIGLYAVIAHSISQRRKEIGVRMAIGATPRNIGEMLLRDGMAPVSAGVLLGLTAALAVNRVLQSLLVGVSPDDPSTMAIVTLALIFIALLACQIPARQAMKVDPAITLRQD
jgi:predicted permease